MPTMVVISSSLFIVVQCVAGSQGEEIGIPLDDLVAFAAEHFPGQKVVVQGSSVMPRLALRPIEQAAELAPT